MTITEVIQDLEKAREQIDTTPTVLNRLLENAAPRALPPNGTGAPPVIVKGRKNSTKPRAQAKPKPKAPPAPAKKGGRGRIDPALREKAIRLLAGGKKAAEVAAATGLKVEQVYALKCAAKKAGELDGKQKPPGAPWLRCQAEKCGQRGWQDPCEHCGAKR